MGYAATGTGSSSSGAVAASAGLTGNTLGGGPALPGGYTGQLSFEEWKKRKGLLPGQYAERDAWEQWQADSTEQSLLRSKYGSGQERLPVAAEPEPEEEQVGSTPGFEKVQRFLRQQRATGRVVSPGQTRMAWQGYWDAWAGKQAEREKLGIEAERLDLQKEQFAWQREFSEEGLEYTRKQEESSAMASGMSMIGMGVGFAVGGPVGGMIGGMIGGAIGGSW